ncbi:MAG TPA: pyridoxal-dependent decarboxylase, exosortase A system-associated, partial [Rhodocyclaceae bacterium]|nr:pyridoxal-dependent decarboxylase, exosortase A system-associated [Rhodocyclaceae bacterium]
AERGRTARVAIRVNPAFELRGAGMRMGGGAKPFGVDEETVPALLGRLQSLGLAFEGFHIYCGSQSLNGEAIAQTQRESYALARRLAALAPAPVLSLNLGGGFGIPYFPGEQPLDLAPIADALAEIASAAARELPQARLHLELGRYLVGEAGVYATRIVDKKVSRGETFLITAGGMNHHLAASGNLGQVIRKNYPVAIGNRIDAAPAETVNIHGPLCTPLDVLASKVSLPAAEPGDWVVLFQSGAYGASASPQGFLSLPPAGEILV